MPTKSLIALPVYNEVRHVESVLAKVLRYGDDVLVVDDGSTDGTAALLTARQDICVVSHVTNQGYGAAVATALAYATRHRFDVVVTIDCDGQHEPQRIPQFVAACRGADIVSGSRYLRDFENDRQAPVERREINEQITHELNCRLGLQLTDAFCGFKAYRVDALKHLSTTEPGYAMPLELWAKAARAGLRIIELPVPRIYLPEERSFGGALDDGAVRLEHYRAVLDRAIASASSQSTCGCSGDFVAEGVGQC